MDNNINELENTEVTVEVKEGLGKKVVNGVKKHGKKIAVGAGIAAAGVVGFLLGKRSSEDDDDYVDIDDVEISDADESTED